MHIRILIAGIERQLCGLDILHRNANTKIAWDLVFNFVLQNHIIYQNVYQWWKQIKSNNTSRKTTFCSYHKKWKYSYENGEDYRRAMDESTVIPYIKDSGGIDKSRR